MDWRSSVRHALESLDKPSPVASTKSSVERMPERAGDDPLVIAAREVVFSAAMSADGRPAAECVHYLKRVLGRVPSNPQELS